MFELVCAVRKQLGSGGKQDAKGDAKAADEDDDVDIFGEETEEDVEAAKALQAKIDAEKAAKKAGKGKGERSLIVLDIKPFDAETDLQALAKSIKTIEHEGIQNWGLEHKLEPMAFGVCKLVISVVVYDDLMDVDTLSDMINEKHEDDVQSIDVNAMSKV
jgi:elongation factor 1-beta